MSTVGQAAGGLVGGIAGFFIGGPTGAVYGAQIGLMVGGYLDPPKVKGNHPTTDLSVQTATYGVPVGDGYGNYATYGNVFWVEGNSLRLVTGEDGGGKGGDARRSLRHLRHRLRRRRDHGLRAHLVQRQAGL